MKTKIAIVGYGNIGKSIEKLAFESNDFEIVGVFSRRSDIISPLGSEVYPQSALNSKNMAKNIDVALLAVGSAFDLVDTALRLAPYYNLVDSFDTHAKMREYINALDDITKSSRTLAFVGCGWDPGLFSLERALFAAVVPSSIPQTFWGKGVSQGHSEAIRKLKGVKYAIQYTLPIDSAIKEAREGRTDFTPDEKHTRECFVVLDYAGYYGKDESSVPDEEKISLQERIKEQIVTMPNYFADYSTTVHFIGEEEFLKEHTKAYHGGEVIACSQVGAKSRAELSLTLESNPDFTAHIMLAYAWANHRLQREGATGAKTVLDIPIKYLIDEDSSKFI